jgi:hypothetical protein
MEILSKWNTSRLSGECASAPQSLRLLRGRRSRFTEAMAHLAVALRDPLAEYTELLRAMREGIDDTLETTERELSRMAAEEGHPFDWGGGTFKDLLRGKPGPGGGFETTPAVLAFFLTAYLLDCPRREAAAKALDMTFAAWASALHSTRRAMLLALWA